MKNFINSLLNLIYKRKCYFCRTSKYNTIFCNNCYEKLEFQDFMINRCINNVDIYIAGFYTKELQKLIRGLKYHNKRELAYYQAKFMYEYFSKIEKFRNIEFELIAVPLHQKRVKKRKYNHMELVCEEFSKLSGYKCNFDLIKRIKDTKPQYKLSKKQRAENLSGAFNVYKEYYNNKKLLIIDDICTSGSTFEEIIKSLNSCGIYDITCFATSTPI